MIYSIHIYIYTLKLKAHKFKASDMASNPRLVRPFEGASRAKTLWGRFCLGFPKVRDPECNNWLWSM